VSGTRGTTVFVDPATFGVDTPAVVRGCGMGSGSGWVAVGPLDRGDRGGSNGGG
jgi:hypothetical protein